MLTLAAGFCGQLFIHTLSPATVSVFAVKCSGILTLQNVKLYTLSLQKKKIPINTIIKMFGVSNILILQGIPLLFSFILIKTDSKVTLLPFQTNAVFF